MAKKLPSQRIVKKRRVANSPPSPKRHISSSQTEANTSNRFSGLPIDITKDPVEDTKNRTQTAYPKKDGKPPSIILYGIEELSQLTGLLNKGVPSGSYPYKIINRDQLRISTQSSETYKNFIGRIRKNGLIGPTFTNLLSAIELLLKTCTTLPLNQQ